VQSDIKTISEEILRVSKIVRKYSEIGRKDDFLTEEVNVNQVLARLLEVFRGGHEKIEIRKSLDSAMPMVSMSSDSFKQVIVNLVKNAIEGQNHQLSAG
jgi:nitrogen-specific signal transduction histidine kinase